MFSLLQRHQNPFIEECYRFRNTIRSQKSIGRARTPPKSFHSRRKKKRKSINKETIYIEAIDSFSSASGGALAIHINTLISTSVHTSTQPSSVCGEQEKKLKRKVSARCFCGAVLMCIPFCSVKFFIATFLTTRFTCWNVDLHFWLSSVPSLDS